MASEIIKDLLRSAWIVERARSHVYSDWAEHDGAYAVSAEVAAERATLVATALGGAPNGDGDLVAPHAEWMRSLIGSRPDEIPLAPMFLIRLADWVDGHAGPFLTIGLDTMTSLNDDEKSRLRLPTTETPPTSDDGYEVPDLDPPGEVLFTFGILADLHIGSERATPFVQAAIDDLNASGAELTIQLGDITDHGHKQEFAEAVALLDKLDMPVTTMMGNHDVFSIDEQRISGREYYSSAFGREPDGVLLEHKGFRFAVLDSIEHGASPFSPFDMVAGRFIEDQSGGAIVRGSLTPPQHEILADVASPDGGPAFVFLHHPVQPFTGFPPVLFGLRDADSGRLHATCDSGNVWGIFAGHTHRNARTRDFDGVPAVEVAIPRDFPFGYGLVDVCEDGYRYRFRQISDTELIDKTLPSVGQILRRYGGGRPEDRSFVWRKPSA